MVTAAIFPAFAALIASARISSTVTAFRAVSTFAGSVFAGSAFAGSVFAGSAAGFGSSAKSKSKGSAGSSIMAVVASRPSFAVSFAVSAFAVSSFAFQPLPFQPLPFQLLQNLQRLAILQI